MYPGGGGGGGGICLLHNQCGMDGGKGGGYPCSFRHPRFFRFMALPSPGAPVFTGISASSQQTGGSESVSGSVVSDTLRPHGL